MQRINKRFNKLRCLNWLYLLNDERHGAREQFKAFNNSFLNIRIFDSLSFYFLLNFKRYRRIFFRIPEEYCNLPPNKSANAFLSVERSFCSSRFNPLQIFFGKRNVIWLNFVQIFITRLKITLSNMVHVFKQNK